MGECVYYTDRDVGNGGSVRAWVLKENCPKCGKALMGKPRNPKTGKPKLRSEEYQCPECGYTVPKQEYEETLTVNIQYTCPHCKHQDQTTTPFKRKKVQRLNEETQKKQSIDAITFTCSKCNQELFITKKMK